MSPSPALAAIPPVVVIGAHRSGTSALSRVLDALGVFVGRDLDPNHESRFFLDLNTWLLRACGGRWDHPEVVDDLLGDREQRALAAEYLRLAVNSPRASAFCGRLAWLGGRRIAELDRPWSFKDPRTTFTLPLWLDLFPDARVVHIHRHGVDVAQSLRRRHVDHLARSRADFARNRALLRWLPKRAGFGESPRCADLQRGFALWRSYVARANHHCATLGDRALVLDYERLAVDPAAGIDRLIRFCRLEPSPDQRARAIALVKPGRAQAWRDDPELRDLAAREAGALDAVRAQVGRGSDLPSPQTAPIIGA